MSSKSEATPPASLRKTSASDRIFDSLEGREFRSARDAERAARALLMERRHLVSGQLSAVF
jgi:hypothetical protein